MEQVMGTDASWTRRGALRYGSAATLAAVGILEHSAASAAQTPEATPAIPADFKVVLHAAEVQHWPYILSNLRNLTSEWPRARLRVVVDGSAVTSLQGENNLTAELGTLVAAGVELQVCPNALHEHQIDPATIPVFAQTTLGGVVALVLAQHEGYAYVKP
jgi:intracellular sulfur oxidation DsrE/DsrF family protein